MDMVIMRNNNAVTTSLLLSQGMDVEHRAILELIRKYKDRKIFQTSTFEPQKLSTKGRSTEYYYLSENQSMFIITLMKNSEKVLDFKEALILAFSETKEKLRKVLTQKENAQWLRKRDESKSLRLECTDVIKEFVNYALDQGSKNASMYYTNISKMELKGLFFLEERFPNMRDAMNIKQLNLIEMADEAIRASLKDGMEAKLHYKEIYQIAKEKIEAIAKIFPHSPLPDMMLSHK